MTNKYKYSNLVIEVADEPAYKYDSTDNNFSYSKHYWDCGAKENPVSKHGVKIYEEDAVVNSCIVLASKGATGIHKHSSLLDGDNLLVCCCNTIFCLKVPELQLKWQTAADSATCFQIFKLEDDYIVHGEMEITRLDKQGTIKWQFEGTDIFVSIDNSEEFHIASDHILLSDFSKSKYKIDFNGKKLWSQIGK